MTCLVILWPQPNDLLALSGVQAWRFFGLALVLFDAQGTDEAIAVAREALELAGQHGDRQHQAAIHSNLADFYQFSGRTADAMEHVTRSVTIYASIGIVAGELQPEIWKVTEW